MDSKPVLPFSIFEQLVKKLLEQQKAEEELCAGFAKYNSDYGPWLEMPLTISLANIISELYEDDNDYPAIDWWIYEGKLDKEKLENPEAKVWYGKKEETILTIKGLWEYMEREYKEKKCQKSS